MTERNQENNGMFRARKIDFTMVSNPILRDKNISFKAKGIYSTICMYLAIPNFKLYKKFLINQSLEGKQAFETGFKELKKAGYLKVYKLHDEKNKYYYEYELLDNPEPPEEKMPDKKAEIPDTDFRCLENQELENRVVYSNTLTNNTDINNISDNPILSYHSEVNEENEKIEKMKEKPITKKKQEENNNIIAENISLDVLLLKYPDKAEKINEIYNLMCDSVNSSKTYFKISGENKPIYSIRKAFYGLDESHIEYIIDSLEKNTTKILNYKAYLLTTIYNSYFTYSNAVGLSFNHDFKDTMFVKQ